MARFTVRCQDTNVTEVYSYVPTNDAVDEEKNTFYNQLQTVYNTTQKRDVVVIVGDFNAKVGSDNSERETVVMRHGLGTRNEKYYMYGETFPDFCISNYLVIGGTIFLHKDYH